MDIREKKILIRADGNAKIGAGHLMRCLTIADALKDGSIVGFVCADEDSAALAESKGFEAYVMHTDYHSMEQELPLWESLLNDSQGAMQKPVILVDSYYVTNAYLEGLSAYANVVLLEDMAKQPFHAPKLINYNAFADESLYEVLQSPYETTYYVGRQYIPIRKEFCDRAYEVREQAEHILITTGGGDSENIAGQILEKIWRADCSYHVVTGRFNPHYETLLVQAGKHGNIRIYHDVKDMAALMEQCDMAVTAGGTTIYELSAIGVPFVCFSYAQNQERLTEYIGKQSIAGYAGAYHMDATATLEEMQKQIWELGQNLQLRKAYSEAEKCLVDGKGASRIAEILKQSQNLK